MDRLCLGYSALIRTSDGWTALCGLRCWSTPLRRTWSLPHGIQGFRLSLSVPILFLFLWARHQLVALTVTDNTTLVFWTISLYMIFQETFKASVMSSALRFAFFLVLKSCWASVAALLNSSVPFNRISVFSAAITSFNVGFIHRAPLSLPSVCDSVRKRWQCVIGYHIIVNGLHLAKTLQVKHLFMYTIVFFL